MGNDVNRQYKIKRLIGRQFDTKNWFVFDKVPQKKNILTQLKAIADLKHPDFVRREIKKIKQIQLQKLEFLLYLQISPSKPEQPKDKADKPPKNRAWRMDNEIGMY